MRITMFPACARKSAASIRRSLGLSKIVSPGRDGHVTSTSLPSKISSGGSEKMPLSCIWLTRHHYVSTMADSMCPQTPSRNFYMTTTTNNSLLFHHDGFPPLRCRAFRQFSSVASSSTLTSTSSDSKDSSNNTKENSNEDKKQKKKTDNASFFFDNLGKIFLLAIASVIATLVRSSAGTRNRNALRDALEEVALVDPMELDDLRLANSALDPETFRAILQKVYQAFPDGTCSYDEFVRCVRRTMAQLKGDAFTVELGHLVDRLMVQVLSKRKVSEESNSDSINNTNMPVSLFLTVLTMALYSETKDRIRVLYEILQHQEAIQKQQQQSPSFVGDSTDISSSNDGTSAPVVSIDQVRAMVGYLQDSCQLPPDTQIVPTETKYPTQQWKRGTPKELVPWQQGGGKQDDLIDLYTFATILRSKSVCAWGECYFKRKFEEDDV